MRRLVDIYVEMSKLVSVDPPLSEVCNNIAANLKFLTFPDPSWTRWLWGNWRNRGARRVPSGEKQTPRGVRWGKLLQSEAPTIGARGDVRGRHGRPAGDVLPRDGAAGLHLGRGRHVSGALRHHDPHRVPHSNGAGDAQAARYGLAICSTCEREWERGYGIR